MSGYREGSEPATMTVTFPLVARTRLIDSVVIPGAVVVLAMGLLTFVLPGPVRLLSLAITLGALAVHVYLWVRLHRPCVLESPFPYRTIRFSTAVNRNNPSRVEVEQIAAVRTVMEMANDTGIFHVVFELTDGRTMPLSSDINYFWGDDHADAIAERVRAFVARVGEASPQR